jgi:hypothetical protein
MFNQLIFTEQPHRALPAVARATPVTLAACDGQVQYLL